MAAEARNTIDAVMRDRGLYEKAREVLGSLHGQQGEGDVFDALRAAGLVDELLQGVKDAGLSLDGATLQLLRGSGSGGGSGGARATSSASASSPPHPAEASPRPSAASSAAAGEAEAESAGLELDPTRRYLRVRPGPGKGRAFLAHLDEEYALQEEEEQEQEEEAGEAAAGAVGGQQRRPTVRRYYVLHLFARGARWQSGPIPASPEPDFAAGGASGELIVDVTPPDAGVLPPAASLLTSLPEADCRLIIVVTLVTQRPRPVEPGLDESAQALARTAAGDVVTDVVGLHTVDWRAALGKPGGLMQALLPVSAVGPGPHSTGAVGSGGLGGLGGGSPGPMGLLPLHIELWPPIAAHEGGADNGDAGAGALGLGSTAAPAPDAVSSALASSSARVSEASRAFFTYAKAWWAEYKALHPSFRFRPVRIFGESEAGEHLPAVTFLTPLQADRAIDSPAAAARFVSLLPFRTPDTTIGGSLGNRAAWRSVHATLAARGGDAPAHALLLASLLLGFGLDAYVVVGSLADPAGGEAEAMWVMTRYPGAGTAAAAAGEAQYGASASPSPGAGSPMRPSGGDTCIPSYRVVFWDPLTGSRSAPGDVLPSGHVYSRVACAFSHARFYACTAGDDSASSLSWALDSPLSPDWKAMDAGLLEGLGRLRACPPPVAPPSLDGPGLATALEAVLKAAVARYRSLPRVAARLAAAGDATRAAGAGVGSSGLSPRKATGPAVSASATRWDEGLGYVLGQALAAYETERLHGLTTGVEDFAVAVKRLVPRGHAFRGFPILFNHASPSRMLDALLAAPAARDVLETMADGTTAFALRVAVTVHAEDTTATWLMLAVRTAIA